MDIGTFKEQQETLEFDCPKKFLTESSIPVCFSCDNDQNVLK